MRTSLEPEQLAEAIARHAVPILLCATVALLILAAVLWRLLVRHAPRAWRICVQAWNVFRTTALAQRIARLPWVGSLLTRTLSAGRFLGLYGSAAFVVAAGAAAAFVELVDETGVGESLREFDLALSAALSEHLSRQTLRVFAWITLLGNLEFLIGVGVLVALVLLWQRRWLLAGAWAAATASGGLLNRLLKALFQRERPLHEHWLVTETSWSFPSGHASGAMLVYALLGYLIVRHTPTPWHLPVALVTAAMIVFVGSSRVLLHVHYFSDVLAGYAFAAAWAALWIAGLEAVRSARAEQAAPDGARQAAYDAPRPPHRG